MAFRMSLFLFRRGRVIFVIIVIIRGVKLNSYWTIYLILFCLTIKIVAVQFTIFLFAYVVITKYFFFETHCSFYRISITWDRGLAIKMISVTPVYRYFILRCSATIILDWILSSKSKSIRISIGDIFFLLLIRFIAYAFMRQIIIIPKRYFSL